MKSLGEFAGNGVTRDADDSSAVAFVLELATALHSYGYPAHRLEETLSDVSRRLGLAGQFFSTPTSLFAAFGRQADQRTYLTRIESSDVDLGKLAELYGTTQRVHVGELSPREGIDQVQKIVSRGPRYAAWLTVASFAISSGAVARFLGGGVSEIAVAALIGLMTGLLALFVPRLPSAIHVFEPIAAFNASVVATIAGYVTNDLSVFLATLSGLIVLIPGLTLTIAMRELATRHLVSGTARLSAALMTFLGIGFGVALGSTVVSLLLGDVPSIDPAGLPSWTFWVALCVAPPALAILFKAQARDIPWVTLSGFVAIGGTTVGSNLFGAQLGVFVGALLVAAGSNLYARILDRPSSVPLVPGLLLLVPGSIGFRSLAELLDAQVVVGVETAFQMMMIAVGLAAGMLAANVIIPPGTSR